MPHPRRDAYGRPLPELVDARQELLRDHPQNRARERFLRECLDEWLGHLLRRDVWGDVAVRFRLEDGVLQREMTISVTRSYLGPATPKPKEE